MNNLLRQSKRVWNQNGSTILTYIGGAGVITTSILTAKATPKAMTLIKEAKQEKGDELTKTESVIIAAPAYIPSVISGAATIMCIFGANVLNKRKQAALISAYALLDSSYKEYKDKVKEMYGDDANKQIEEEIIKDKYKESEIEDENDGKQLFYDEYSKRYFRATNETVLSAEYKVNKMLVDDCYVTLNEYYELLNIPTVDYGDYVGWSAAQMFEMYWSSWINFYHEKIEMDDGSECFVIHVTEPMVDFEAY